MTTKVQPKMQENLIPTNLKLGQHNKTLSTISLYFLGTGKNYICYQ